MILAARGPVFSAGHNFGDMLDAALPEAQRLFQVCTDMMNTVQQIPQVVIAKVHALATAAGCQLVATCDLAVAAESAGFALPGGKGGLFCHTPLVAVGRQIGRKRALEMAMTGDVISAATAAEWGLINRVVPDDELDAAVDDLMARATRGSACVEGGRQARVLRPDRPRPARGLRVRVAGDGGRRDDARRSGGHPVLPREAARQLHAADRKLAQSIRDPVAPVADRARRHVRAPGRAARSASSSAIARRMRSRSSSATPAATARASRSAST